MKFDTVSLCLRAGCSDNIDLQKLFAATDAIGSFLLPILIAIAVIGLLWNAARFAWKFARISRKKRRKG
jgi:hypothetical protein